MTSLGHERFAVAGHDRGARVAYRLALDHPQALSCLAVLDIVPTYDMWHNFTVALAMKIYHWLFLAQPNPLPEMLIERQPIAYLDYTLASWTKAKDLSAFADAALAEYRLHYATPEHVHATCNDYRAGQTCDLADDEADRAAGRRIACPMLVLWGDAGIPAQNDSTVETADPLSIWREWCPNVMGAGIDSGHFVAEENPAATLAHLLPFLIAHAALTGNRLFPGLSQRIFLPARWRNISPHMFQVLRVRCRSRSSRAASPIRPTSSPRHPGNMCCGASRRESCCRPPMRSSANIA